MEILFILVTILVAILLFFEIAHKHDSKLLRKAEDANKQQKIELIHKCYFESSAIKIRKTLKNNG